jgi:hypothetical protein
LFNLNVRSVVSRRVFSAPSSTVLSSGSIFYFFPKRSVFVIIFHEKGQQAKKSSHHLPLKKQCLLSNIYNKLVDVIYHTKSPFG